jgi:diadenosine tetraphosphate (Ap4A) HIT family hydrolase
MQNGITGTTWELIMRMKLLETDKVFAFVDIGPIARGHSLVIPKCTFQLHATLKVWYAIRA